MTRKSRRLVVLLCALAALGVAPGAMAASPVISDCNANARLTRQYSVSQLQSALTTMPADVKEYTDCYDVIQRALLSEASNPHSSPTSSSKASTSSFPPTPVIVVLVLVVLAGAAIGGLVIRRRRNPS